MTNINYERQLLERYSFVAGMDEVGRGPLAGPVVAACVVIDKNVKLIRKVRDSKILDEKTREELFDEIIGRATDYSIALATHKEIDKYNILNATQLAMNRAVAKLQIKPEHTIIDGRFSKPFEFESECIIKGDDKHFSIASASILAKVFRDRMMKYYAERYPEYGFDGHKGYGTKDHYLAIEKYGPCPIHRISFIHQLRML